MNPAAINAIWTLERIEQLTQLASESLSSSQIGHAMGLTRNQVIGKLSRLGVPLLSRPFYHAPEGVIPRPRAQKPRVPGTKNGGEPIAPTPLNTHVTAPDFVPMLLLEAGAYNCRWDMGRHAPGQPLVCGSNTVAFGIPWCVDHLKLIRITKERRR